MAVCTLKNPGRAAIARRRRRYAGSLLEMMLALPILIMLGFGVVDYGYLAYVKNTVQGAAQTAARTAITASATNTSVKSAITSVMTGAGLQNSGYTVTFTPSDVSTATLGGYVTVSISVSWANVGTHMLGSAWGGLSNSTQINGTAVMMKE